MEATGTKLRILEFVEKQTYASATKVYPNSKGLYDFILAKHFTGKEKLKVIANGSSNGIDTKHFNRNSISEIEKNVLRQSLKLQSNIFVFIFVGRLVGDKGINELVQAFSKLNNERTKLLLVGSLESELDPLRSETLKEINENQNIISVGFQKDVRPYLSISNALVFPSYREGFPNVVMQAGAMELPAIVSNINGCNEIIVEGENGIIVPVKNVDAIQKAMDIMLMNTELYLKMKENSRKMITDRYEQQVVWDALLDEYKRLLKEKGLINV
jgi:glycosyltransferase involved in cell wall biosynthesis